MLIRTSLLAGTAVALSLLAAPVIAQQQKGPEASEQGKGNAQNQPQEKGKGSAQTQQPQEKGKGSAQTQQPQEKGKGSAQTQQPQEKGKGSAQTQQPQEKGKGSAQTQQPQEKGKGSARTQLPQEKGKGSAQTQQPQEKGKGAATAPSSGGRMQLSEQQRTNVHGTILKESNVNRATNVNFSINVGTRVPRSVHLVVLPASVISLVPQFRSYQYFVANDQICIVDPRTYEIVEVISEPGRMAGGENRGSARLVLTEDEKRIILQNVEFDRSSTLGLGSLTEGAEVPRSIQVRVFPDAVVRQVPKVRDYKFFTAENRVAIVDLQGSKVQLVIEERR